jgi:prepilin-type N-terminal cleavage/methylation domain-containing protein
MSIKKISAEQGFTLIELLVSIALFSIVLTVSLGTIITIADSNKKARSLMSVMNNLNFAVDSITRSFKTGEIDGDPVNGDCLTTDEIDYADVGFPGGGFETRRVEYCWVEDNETEQGSITKKVDNGDPVALTSPDVDIDFLEFKSSGYQQGSQPMVNIILEGTVKVSESIRSKFSIQTAVSQRQLNI